MKIPDEFSSRVFKLKRQPMSFSSDSLSEVNKLLEKEWPGAYTDVIYESQIEGYKHNINITHVIVFETTEDALTFKIKYGDKYV